MNFDDSLKRLKEICQSLSNDNTSLEETVNLYKEGIELSDKCLTAITEMKNELNNLNCEK